MRRINFLLLPLVWMALTGEFSAANFMVGLVISSLALWVTSPPREVLLLDTLRRLGRWTVFFCFFIWELFLASLRVLHDILTPRHRMRPAILAIPLDLQTDLQITLLANLLILTPGTLALEVSPDRKVLYLHAMYVDDVEQFRREIRENLVERVRKVTT